MRELLTVDRIIRSILLGLCLTFLIAAVYAPFRDPLRSWYFAPFRKVLSTAQGDVFNNKSDVLVVKVETEKGLSLEILGTPHDGQRTLLEVIPLPDRRDGYFHFRGQAANLALHDLNGDGSLEIFAPSFDEQMIPHLNVFRYNPSQGRFESAGP